MADEKKPQPKLTSFSKVIIREATDEEQFKALEGAVGRYDEMKQRMEQSSLNTRWLIERIDNIHNVLCPGQMGTWQQRAEQAELAAAQLAEALKPIIHFIEQWDRQPLAKTTDEFYGIHTGTQFEASLRLSQFRKFMELLRKPHQRAHGDGR